MSRVIAISPLDQNVQWRGEQETSREYGGEIALALTQPVYSAFITQLMSALGQKQTLD
jgi:hypothetical protein